MNFIALFNIIEGVGHGIVTMAQHNKNLLTKAGVPVKTVVETGEIVQEVGSVGGLLNPKSQN